MIILIIVGWSAPQTLNSSVFWLTASGEENHDQHVDMLEATLTPTVAEITPNTFTADIIIEDDHTTLLALAGPEGTLADVTENPETEQTINDRTIYTVREGDSVGSVARLFGLNSDTIRVANKLDSNTKLKPGQKLDIPPMDGIPVVVKSGETADTIARRYNVDTDDILNFNYIQSANSLRVGQKIFIPGADATHAAKLAAKEKEAAAQRAREASGPSAGSAKSNKSYAFSGRYRRPAKGPITSGYGKRWGRMHKGIDFDGVTGDPIYAAAAGNVKVAKVGNGYGKMVVLSHGASETLYAHMSRIAVSPGQSVAAGDIIGYIGNTGNSTGSHLHFEIRINGSAVNPAKYLNN